ncbi:GFA domain-containing protein [Mycena venus]|uniref:GFA domain-containing protein n=1 Tax=Mycena venus TaxID=2733690 RepID=A0A8H7D294_9AGAR|nr:GFA domain-containing protein [Mycena venus]
MSDSAPLVEYHGNCHCGAFKFTFKAREITQAKTCDCAICSKNGYIWGQPDGDSFTVVKGDENALVSYEFGKRALAHKFCSTCGSSVMVRWKIDSMGKAALINIRTVQNLDSTKLPLGDVFKGSTFGDAYQPPAAVPTGPVPDGSTVYHGSCHCGAVAYTLHSPEEITSATDCNCSICWRNAAVWAYPQTTQLTFRGVPDTVTEYAFSSHKAHHCFCKTCGVSVYTYFTDFERMEGKTALNLRTVNGFDLGSLDLKKGNGRELKPLYEVPA